jgi:nitrogen PTS system EIIA component
MKISDLVDRDNIVLDLRAPDKAQVLRELSRRAGSALSIGQDVILSALQAREALGSTGLGRGFALPHARLDQLNDFFALFARLARPVNFASIDDKPIDLVILLLIPANAGKEHLATLAALARPLRDQTLLQRLREAANVDALYDLLAGP